MASDARQRALQGNCFELMVNVERLVGMVAAALDLGVLFGFDLLLNGFFSVVQLLVLLMLFMFDRYFRPSRLSFVTMLGLTFTLDVMQTFTHYKPPVAA